MSIETDLKETVDNIGKSFEELKKNNNELIEKQKKSEDGLSELKVKEAKIDEYMNEQLELKKSLEEVQAFIKSGGINAKLEKEGIDPKHFNDGIKKWFKSGMPADLNNMVGMNKLEENQVKALQSNIDTQGGFTDSPFMGMIEKIIFDTSPMRSLASVETIGSNEYVGFYDDDEMASGWVGEIESRADTDTADLGQYRIPINEMYARFKISERLLEDSDWNIEQWAQQKVADKFGRTEATAFVTGANVLQPVGLNTATSKTSDGDVYTREQIGAILGTAAVGAIDKDELIDVRALLKPGYRSNAFWLFNRMTESVIRKLTDGQSNYLWQPSYQAGEPDSLLGQRIAIFEDLPDLAASTVSVVLADLRSTYKIVDRVGMSVLRDPFTAASSGQIVMHFRKRVGGGIVNWDSAKYLVQAAS